MTSPTSAVVHARVAPRRATARAATWWGKAWVRAVEESAYTHEDLTRARAISRSGRVGGIIVDRGTFVAAVEDDGGLWTVSGTVAVLADDAVSAFVETVAAESGRIAALLAGDLPHTLVEHAEEAGAELLPFGGELGATCTCEAWAEPCRHALAVLYQLTWLLEADPFVLLHLRGLTREQLLARLHARSGADEPGGPNDPDDPGVAVDELVETDLDLALEAAVRAARELAQLEAGGTPTRS